MVDDKLVTSAYYVARCSRGCTNHMGQNIFTLFLIANWYLNSLKTVWSNGFQSFKISNIHKVHTFLKSEFMKENLTTPCHSQINSDVKSMVSMNARNSEG